MPDDSVVPGSSEAWLRYAKGDLALAKNASRPLTVHTYLNFTAIAFVRSGLHPIELNDPAELRVAETSGKWLTPNFISS